MEISGYELEQALVRTVREIGTMLVCKHKWKEPENIDIIGRLGGAVVMRSIQRCEYCNFIRVLDQGGGE